MQDCKNKKNSIVTMTIGSDCLITGATIEQLDKIKRALTLINPAYKNAVKYQKYCNNISKYLTFWKETKFGLSIPRGFVRSAYDMLGSCKIIDITRTFEQLSFVFSGIMYDYQTQAVKETKKKNFAVFQCSTGGGKTVIALAMIALRQQPTLIIVHNKELLYQWQRRIDQFLGVDAGLVGDGKYDVRHITVGIVNSVAKHLDYLKNRFGFLIIDECHRCPATTFTEVVKEFDSGYMLGLTATPERRDNLHPVTNFFLGDTVYCATKKELEQIGVILKPEIIQIKTDFWFGGYSYPSMMTALTNNDRRNKLIINAVMQYLERGTCIIVSDRVTHCELLADLLRKRGYEPTVLTGKTKKNERKKIVSEIQSGKIKILISTISLIGEGFDCSALTTLVLATPIKSKSRLIQVIGRILRPAPGKKPLVIDFDDSRVRLLRSRAAYERLQILRDAA